MFQIHKSTEKKGQLLTIISNCETTKAEIYLSLGGSLNRFMVQQKEIITNLTHLPYNQTYSSSILFPFANRIKDGTYNFQNKEYNLDCNEINANNALHGLVYNKTFTLDEQSCSSESAIVRLSYTQKEPHPGFPFLFTINLIYKISISALELEVKITNTGTQSFPFTLGWHPYFKIYNRAESKLRFNSFQKLESNDENITTGIKPLKTPNPLFLDNVCLDDAFILEDNNVGFETHEYNANLTFSYPSNYLQLYTPTHSNSIAIEPMTGISDSFNNGIGLKKLKAGEKFNVNWLLKISTNPNQHE